MRTSAQVVSILEAARINPNSFEAELGLLVHKWLHMMGVDEIIEAVDHEIDGLEFRRDSEMGLKGPTPSRR